MTDGLKITQGFDLEYIRCHLILTFRLISSRITLLYHYGIPILTILVHQPVLISDFFPGKISLNFSAVSLLLTTLMSTIWWIIISYLTNPGFTHY